MSVIEYRDKRYKLNPGETVLDGLLRHDATISHSCRAGVCQSCLMKSDLGSVNPSSQIGLKATLQSQGYFLACQCVPEEDMRISSPELVSTSVAATVVGKTFLCHNVVALRVQCDEDFPVHPGQYINLHVTVGEGPEPVARSYSVANLADRDGFLELHIRHIESGVVSTHVHEHLAIGDDVRVSGPMGECFYLLEGSDQDAPLLLAGTGTGLAPLEGVVRSALAQGHRGPIHLLHGALHSRDLYHVGELQDLAVRHANFHYTACVLDTHDANATIMGAHIGPLDQMAVDVLSRLGTANVHAYFCGAPEMVNALRKKSFLAGVASKHILSDPFLKKT